MSVMADMIRGGHSLMLRFLLAGSDALSDGNGNMSDPRTWPKRRVIWIYGTALVSVAVALLLSQWPALHLEAAPVSLFFCAVMLSAWFGGFGPGLLATVLSTLVFYYYFLSPMHSLSAKPEEIPRLIVFALSALVVGTLSAAQRSATESLRRAHKKLTGTVQELQKTNEALQTESLERKHAEDKLRRSETYLAEGQRLSHTGSWAWDVATRELVHWSREHYRLFGFNSEDGRLSLETIRQRIHPDDQDRVLEVWDRAIRDGSDYQLDFRVVLPDRGVTHIHAEGHPVFNASGDLVEFLGTSMDVTERRLAEEEREKLRQAQADLARVSRVTTMGELTASLAHEVNQPIAAAVTDAKTCLRWLAGARPNLEEARETAARMVKDATRAAEIVSRIRSLFKKSTVDREWVDTNEVIREMIVLLRNEAMRYSVSVRTELAAELPQVMGDRVQLQQVVMNLIINSLEAMKDEHGMRELAIRSQPLENGHIIISVSDTGVGLPQQQADQIFDAFFTTKLQGTGMGLSISRSIVESHGGRLWAAANSPRGATFHLTLPTKVEAHE
jgi:PAS domain S-box-containing protein